jgi:hypothetical protein
VRWCFRLAILAILSLDPCLSYAAEANDVHIFYGEIKAVDPAAKTLAISSGGKTLVFHYSDKTKLSSYWGYVRWDKIQSGSAARVTMHLGEGNVGIADEVRIDPPYANASKVLSLYRARTTKGEVVSGVAVANYVVTEPRDQAFSRATMPSTPNVYDGVFVLSVNPDGSVAKVAAAKSFAEPELNERAAGWLRKWRFRAGAVSEVQIPVMYHRIF